MSGILKRQSLSFYKRCRSYYNFVIIQIIKALHFVENLNLF